MSTWMNRYEIEEAAIRWKHDPVLGPATRTLEDLMLCADSCSDGWVYWPKPSRAARKLQELIQSPLDANPARLKAAYVPLKAFRTRTGLSFEIEETR